MNNVKLLHYTVLFFSNFSLVSSNGFEKFKKIWPSQEKVEMTPLGDTLPFFKELLFYSFLRVPANPLIGTATTYIGFSVDNKVYSKKAFVCHGHVHHTLIINC